MTTPAVTVPKRAWSVEAFKSFWARPDASLVHHVITPDIKGYWPYQADPVTGDTAYVRVIAVLLELVPDLALIVEDHATDGDTTFVRYRGTGTLEGRRVNFDGIDCLKLREDGLVRENRIFAAHPLFARLAERVSLAR